MPLAQSQDHKGMVSANAQHSQYSSSEAPRTVSMAANTEQVAGVGVSGIRAQELDMNTSMSQTQANQPEQSSYKPISESSATANVN